VTEDHPRVLVLGLDSVPPDFLFDRFLPQMPHLKSLLDRGQHGTLRTIDPPITVPAWAVMFTGVDPGTLGIYGFRHRRPRSYWDNYTPTPQMIPQPPIWEILSRMGRRVCVIGMPPGYPPPKVNGVYISDFLTPSSAKDFCHPQALVPEVQAVSGGYTFDVTFRADDRERIATELFTMTQRRFKVARHLWAKEKWDFFALHEIGPDRLHHAFWKFFDTTHPRHEEHPQFTELADRYYAMVDEEIGQLLETVDDKVNILVASDHGSQAMDGCFCINQWLIDNDYLAINGPTPPRGTALEKMSVNWSKTSVWGAGGYYARLNFNIRGREPQGIVDPKEVPELRRRLAEDLEKVRLPNGQPLAPEVRAPDQIYRQVRGDAPDLMAYFGHLKWRSAGTLGYDSLFLDENDTGPDDSVHSFDGVFLLARPDHSGRTALPQQSILDVGPSLLKMMEVPVPNEMQGRAIPAWL
jgi:predicted AlkP superfamily phosphohydrolase/phosphomutase